MPKRRYTIGTVYTFGILAGTFRAQLLSEQPIEQLAVELRIGTPDRTLIETLEHARWAAQAWKEAKTTGRNARAGVAMHAAPACYHLRYSYGISAATVATVLGIPVKHVHNYAATYRMMENL